MEDTMTIMLYLMTAAGSFVAGYSLSRLGVRARRKSSAEQIQAEVLVPGTSLYLQDGTKVTLETALSWETNVMVRYETQGGRVSYGRMPKHGFAAALVAAAARKS